MINSQGASNCSIELKNVSLIYDLYYDKTNTLKERVINLLHRREYVEKKEAKLSALDDVSIRFNQGERVGIIGLNGSGKSTLLKVISGILKPSFGTLSISGKVQPLIEIGAGFNPEFSGRDNIYLNGYMLGFSPAAIKEKEKEIVEFTELGHFIDLPIKYYSSGMAVRLAFTIATMIQPEILVFDEMLSAGDASFIQKAKKRMETLLAEAKMLILVSHDLSLIQSLASRTLVLHKGKIVFDGSTKQAIKYYLDSIASTIGAEERLANPQVTSQIELGDEGLISIKSHAFNSLSTEPSSHSLVSPTRHLELYPGDTAVFYLTFETCSDFDEIFINLDIKENSGLIACHLRNDFNDNIHYRNVRQGEYQVELTVHKIPWKSGKYSYHFRIVGKSGDSLKICDSESFPLTILGNQTTHLSTKNDWKLDYQPTL